MMEEERPVTDGQRPADVRRRAVNRSMFWRVLRRSVFANRGRLFVILLALGAGSAVTAALLNLQIDAKRRVTTEFRSFGPNVLIGPNSIAADKSNTLDESLAERLQSRNEYGDIAAIPYLYLTAKVYAGGVLQDAIIAGTHLDLLENREPGWKTSPSHPSEYSAQDCVVGVRLAKRLRVDPGSPLQLRLADRNETCTIAATLTSGLDEDDQVFVPLSLAQELAREPGRISLLKIFIPGDAAAINEIVRKLGADNSEIDVKPIRQFTEGEARLYGKISGVLTATVAVVLVLTALCVMAAMTNIAAERKNDVGLMKAIGGSVRRVLRIFLAEAALLGLAGGLIGAAAGIAISIGLGKAVFGVAAQPRLVVYPISVGLTVAVAVLAAYPLRRLALIRPAAVFRGEE